VGNGPHYWLDMQSQFDMWQAQVKLNDELIKIKTLPDFPLKRISKFPTDRFS
jgi:plasmid maintenance system antidote protein VapI